MFLFAAVCVHVFACCLCMSLALGAFITGGHHCCCLQSDMQTESASLSSSAPPEKIKAIPLPHTGFNTQSAGVREINLGGCWALADLSAKLYSFNSNRNDGPFVDPMSLTAAKMKCIFLNISHSLEIVLSNKYIFFFVLSPACSLLPISNPSDCFEYRPAAVACILVLVILSCLQSLRCNSICQFLYLLTVDIYFNFPDAAGLFRPAVVEVTFSECFKCGV